MTNKQAKYIHIADVINVVIDPTTDVGFTENLVNLHSMIEAISGADGVQIQVSAMRIHIRLYIESEVQDAFCIIPVIVQTVGTWTSTADLANNTIRQMLDSCIGDVLGYTPLGSLRVSKLLPTHDSHISGMEFTLSIPQHILQLLNKETESERLQHLLVGLVGKFEHQDNANLIGTAYVESLYTERRKSIVIR